MEFMHGGLPEMKLQAVWKKPVAKTVEPDEKGDLGPVLKELLARPDICSKHYLVRQYDHEVQGGSVVKPLTGAFNDGPSDAGVMRPVLDSFRGVVTAHGIVPRYSAIDTYGMVLNAIDEAMRNYVAVGGDPAHVAGLDNFCWCDPIKSPKNPDGEYHLARLVRANRALLDACTALGVPLISGKDSMKNDYINGDVKISILPTVLFSVIGVIPDIRRAVTMDAKRPGDLVYVIGKTRSEMGASEYWNMIGVQGGKLPEVNPRNSLHAFMALHKAIMAGLVASCHDCSDGGLAVALAETAFAGDLGVTADLWKASPEGIKRNDHLLFSESATRFVVTVSPQNAARFEEAMDGVVCARAGEVTATKRLVIKGINGGTCLDEPLAGLKDAWLRTLDF
jgi:phosphoribosylformylglycinamidine synthase